MLEDWLLEKLKERQKNNLLRKLNQRSGNIDFSSNDYLGLARSEQLHQSILKELQSTTYNGATGSRLLSGNSSLHIETEKFLAEFFHGEAALIYPSGYMANLGVLSSIPGRGDTILYDELSHASIKDGIRLSHAQILKFKHNDSDDLDRLLGKVDGRKYVVLESVYSMDGDTCKFEEIIAVSKRHYATVIVDEAHSTGVYGEIGEGLLIAGGHEADIRIYTFGKAMGIHGACVVGSQALINYLVNFSRPFIYSTAVPPHQLVSIRSSFDILRKEKNRIKELHEIIIYFKGKIFEKGLTEHFLDSETAIQGIKIPGNQACRKISGELNSAGFMVFPVLSPTVPAGSERIRICLHSYNTEGEINELMDKLEELL